MKLWELLTELPYVEETRGNMNTEIKELTSCFSVSSAHALTLMITHGKRWKTAALL